jgi:Tfp pilus assembly protein PilE
MKKINQFGRSMVEMLGVLAIVGILSVGAITGYSKAMMKYKLNKQTEQIGSVMDNMHIHIEDLIKAKEGMNASNGTDLKSILIKMNVIPKEMIKGSNIKDIFGNNVNFGITVAQGYHWFETTISTGANKDICINLFNIAMQKRNDICRVKISKGGAEGGDIYGDKDCTAQRTCLKNMTLSDFEEKCSFCDGSNRCTFYFQDRYK